MTSPHPAILSVGSALPPNFADQETLIAALSAYWGSGTSTSSGSPTCTAPRVVGGRHLALPLAEYPALDSFAQANDAFIRVGAEVGEAAMRDALARAPGSRPRDVDHLYFVTVTGHLDAVARRAAREPARPEARR